jgi:hypothetical protein
MKTIDKMIMQREMKTSLREIITNHHFIDVSFHDLVDCLCDVWTDFMDEGIFTTRDR